MPLQDTGVNLRVTDLNVKMQRCPAGHGHDGHGHGHSHDDEESESINLRGAVLHIIG